MSGGGGGGYMRGCRQRNTSRLSQWPPLITVFRRHSKGKIVISCAMGLRLPESCIGRKQNSDVLQRERV